LRPTARFAASGNLSHGKDVKCTGSIGLAALIWRCVELFHTTGLMKENAMNRIAAIALYTALTAAPGMSAYGQPASAPEAKSQQTQRAAEQVIHCSNREGDGRDVQPCRARQADEVLRIGTNVSRQEIECRLSGNCGVDDRARVNG
jgi:hypothetical protein